MKNRKNKKNGQKKGFFVLLLAAIIVVTVLLIQSERNPNGFGVGFGLRVSAASAEKKTSLKTSDIDDVDEVTGATEKEFNEIVKWICDRRDIDKEDCPFYGKGDILVQIEEDYKISGLACLSIWTWESGFGVSKIAKNRNNYGGITGSDGYRYFDTVDDGMLYQGKLLRDTYVDKGYDDWDSIAKVYCPPNKQWASNVTTTLETYAEKLIDIMG